MSTTPKKDANRLQALATAINSFSFALMEEVSRRESGRNIVLSPFSVFTGLAMLYQGAGQSTRQVMAEVMRLSDTDTQSLSQTFADLWDELQATAGQLEVANSLWVNQMVELHALFLEEVRQSFGGVAKAVDFQSPQTVGQINRWVEEQTKEKIPTIVDQIDPATLLVLLNAVYFKGAWRFPFKEGRTERSLFSLEDGRTKQVPMMHMPQATDLYYYKDRKMEVVQLPYAAGQTSMYIFLPAKGKRVNDFLLQFKVEQWNRWLKRLRRKKGKVILPRFRAEYALSLNEPLKSMGLAAAFDPRTADFSQIAEVSPQKLFIGEVRHKALLEVHEAGTEAAAATAFTMVFSSMRRPPPPFTMIVDRPFFCVIRDNPSGVVLFAGAIVNP